MNKLKILFLFGVLGSFAPNEKDNTQSNQNQSQFSSVRPEQSQGDKYTARDAVGSSMMFAFSGSSGPGASSVRDANHCGGGMRF